MDFISTRGKDRVSSSLEAIFKGLAKDGGLYVKEKLPTFEWEKYIESNTSYDEIAADVIHAFFSDISIDTLKDMTKKAYKEKFYVDNALQIEEFENLSVAELYHGPTAAFKDFALSMLPQFLTLARGEKKVYILTATSGDTGKAALEGFKNLEGIEIFVFYPTDGVSSMQKLQMMTQEGDNVHVFAVNGNFDDAQRGVKEIFQNKEIDTWASENQIYLSSANSINIGRLVPQIAYYIYSYIELVKTKKITLGEKIDICVPTGNFGNILAAYYAKKMSLPFENFICASNENSVLRDFFTSGIYNSNRELVKTSSPSMDILVSSNLERLLFEVTCSHEKVNKWMKDLKDVGKFEVDTETKENLKNFYGYSCDSQTAAERIKEVFEEESYLMDTHTAVAYDGVLQYRKDGFNNYILLISTASPYKFPESVAESLGIEFDGFKEAIENIKKITSCPVDKPLIGLEKKEILHKTVINKDEMAKVIQEV